MPANTAKGYPYPLPTEPVAQGADAIKNLANAIDARDPAMTLIQSVGFTTQGSPATFFSVPQTYRALVIEGLARDAGGILSGLVAIRFNADAAANYCHWTLTTTDTVAAGVTGGNSLQSGAAGVIPGQGSPNYFFGPLRVFIPDYAASAHYKSWLMQSGAYMGGNGIYLASGGGGWNNNGPITRIDLWAPNTAFMAQSYFNLYGVR